MTMSDRTAPVGPVQNNGLTRPKNDEQSRKDWYTDRATKCSEEPRC